IYSWDGDPAHPPIKVRDLPGGDDGTGWEGFASLPDRLTPQTTLRLVGDRGDAFIYGPDGGDAKDILDPMLRTSRTDTFPVRGLPLDDEAATVPGSVPATLSLSLGGAASFGAFTPGAGGDYGAHTSATVTSTAGDAALAVSGPMHLTNGAFSLPSAVQV